MYLTEFEMERLRSEWMLRYGRGDAVLSDWDMRLGWPEPVPRVIWKVELQGALASLAEMDPRSTILCRALRSSYDPFDDAPWVFVPGDVDPVVWLLPAPAPVARPVS